ncbi:hypothetical protein C3941_09310 [Kaistia algarum]|uniref:hypothetical protein n=1 Tax=Kaistia algarum TaxID=2083279 RepID=UPI000CE92C43|nr:hypothetical protein [Kaistia algarum]MCX5512257.1 hypothetical protein [Kaistia algarum]PPE80348.1 hypothetical protein C3941_09310 [Kaistia algarum]
MAGASIRLPSASFGEFAAILVALASQEAMGIEALEVLHARLEIAASHDPDARITAGVIGRSLVDSRRTADVLASWQAALRDLAPHELAIRTFFSRLGEEADAA